MLPRADLLVLLLLAAILVVNASLVLFL